MAQVSADPADRTRTATSRPWSRSTTNPDPDVRARAPTATGAGPGARAGTSPTRPPTQVPGHGRWQWRRRTRTTAGTGGRRSRRRAGRTATGPRPASVSILPVARAAARDDGPARSRGARTSTSGAARSTCARSSAASTTRCTSYWFRVEWEGLEKIPHHGGALLIANHAGAIPSDAPAIMHGIEEELGRPVYGLADYFFRTIPVVGTMWSRTGGVPAHPDNAYRLLHDQQQLALVFPEGTKATSKTYTDRYRLRRFGRGGFVEIAMRAGVPDHPHRRGGRRGVHAHPVPDAQRGQAAQPAVLSGHRQRPAAGAASAT